MAAVHEHLRPRPVGRVEGFARQRGSLQGFRADAVRLEGLGMPTHDPSKERPVAIHRQNKKGTEFADEVPSLSFSLE